MEAHLTSQSTDHIYFLTRKLTAVIKEHNAGSVNCFPPHNLAESGLEILTAFTFWFQEFLERYGYLRKIPDVLTQGRIQIHSKVQRKHAVR